jgi:hypothetical protein
VKFFDYFSTSVSSFVLLLSIARRSFVPPSLFVTLYVIYTVNTVHIVNVVSTVKTVYIVNMGHNVNTVYIVNIMYSVYNLYAIKTTFC